MLKRNLIGGSVFGCWHHFPKPFLAQAAEVPDIGAVDFQRIKRLMCGSPLLLILLCELEPGPTTYIFLKLYRKATCCHPGLSTPALHHVSKAKT